MKRDSEYIICAAVSFNKYPKRRFSFKRFEFINEPFENGLILCGYRHADIYDQFKHFSAKMREYRIEEGFLTSKNRFVSREEALIIAKTAGQVNALDVESQTLLISQDLY